MKLFQRAPQPSAMPPAADLIPAALPTCLQCGVQALDSSTTFCRRCGLPYGAPPRIDADLPSCPICYATVDDDGRIASRTGGGRLDLVSHIEEHERYPVGDDDFLETLREGDRIRIGRFVAPFDLVRRYLVTGSLDGGRRRVAQHNAIVTAMAQVARWGPNATVFGDQSEWREAREAVSRLMERYARGAVPR
jgi:hypothetical protein